MCVIFFGIDVFFTMRSNQIKPIFLDPIPICYKVLIHDTDTGYVVVNGTNKKMVSYRLDNGKWINQYFWNTELKIPKGAGDASEITDVSPNNLQ